MPELSEMIAVMQAKLAGEKIEFEVKGGGIWKKASDPIWDWEAFNYRVAYKVPMSVDWEALQDDIVAIVPGHNGVIYGVTDMPEWKERLNGWCTSTGAYYDLSCVKSAVRGTVTGRDAIAIRPGHEAKKPLEEKEK